MAFKQVEKPLVEHLDVLDAAKALGIHHTVVRKGLQQRVFPWGYGIKTTDNRWAYFINKKKFEEIEGVKL